MLIVGQQFIWNLGFALQKCERVTIATFMCVYAVAAALAVLIVGVATSFPCQSCFFHHLSGKVEV